MAKLTAKATVVLINELRDMLPRGSSLYGVWHKNTSEEEDEGSFHFTVLVRTENGISRINQELAHLELGIHYPETPATPDLLVTKIDMNELAKDLGYILYNDEQAILGFIF